MASSDGHGGEALAPVTYLPGVTPQSPPRARRRSTVTFTESAWVDEVVEAEDTSAGGGAADIGIGDTAAGGSAAGDTPHSAPESDEPDRETVLRQASQTLTRSLGRRGLSIAEANGKLRTSGLTAEESATMIDEFIERGWLDDAVLAEQLVHTSTTRQDMGTRAVRQLLQKRMLAREVIDAVIAELPDDDAERATEFARSKARSLRNLDRETALRRLTGQLARRGYGGSVAMTAARTALDENPGPASGVRFR